MTARGWFPHSVASEPSTSEVDDAAAERILPPEPAGAAGKKESLPKPVERFLHLLACPRTGERLRIRGDALFSELSGYRYPIRNGVPILTPFETDVEIKQPTACSNGIPPRVKQRLRETKGWALNLGAGGSEESFPRCLELETAIWRHTDVVGDAHRLPFQSGAFDYVVALNAFEHLSDPSRAASEIWRVLTPGGSLYILTAFLQPLHEAPNHYYNCTEFGLRLWFSQFRIDSCSVSGNFNPIFALAWMASEIGSDMEKSAGPEDADLLGGTKLGELRRIWEDEGSRQGPLWDAFFRLPQELQKKYSAGFELCARKLPESPPPRGAGPAEEDLVRASAGSLVRALLKKLRRRLNPSSRRQLPP